MKDMTTTLQRVAFEFLISIKNVYRQLHCNEMVTSALDAYRKAPSMLLPPFLGPSSWLRFNMSLI